jgi:dTDP-4-dehydrorhamnose reductase
MKLLIFGAGSKLAQSLYHVLKENASHTSSWVSSKERPEWFSDFEWITGDILDSSFVQDTVKNTNPDVIINLAAYTNVDGCEDDKFVSHQVNFEFPKLLSQLTLDNKKLIHISTDYVFDGKEGLYKINDVVSESELCWYALSKKDSEKVVLESNACIIRTNVLYGSEQSSPDFLSWLKKQYEANQEISIVYDQFNNPTLYRDLAICVMKVIEKDLKGIIHSGGQDWMSRWELAQVYALSLNKDPELLELNPVATQELNQKAIRPLYGGLDISESELLLDMKFTGIYDYILEHSTLNTEELQTHYLIFKRTIFVLRKIPNELRKNSFIKLKKNPHKTISIIIQNNSVWSEIEIGLKSFSGLLYGYNSNSSINLHIGDIYDEITIENFINSLHAHIKK